ncbi:unnamed protein product [marine sediment metagenome]|uniref:Uncharacterized protein n=1 Tax=marine sediment metagenome TaxID=412755 RepID=X1C4Y2_9ZZZZ
MKSKTWIMGAAGPLVLGIMTSTAHAGPFTSPATDLGAATAGSSFVDKIASRRCWRNGKRHCTWYGGPRAYGNRSGGDDYYEHDSDKLPFGSQRWWDQMLRENRLNPGGGRG